MAALALSTLRAPQRFGKPAKIVLLAKLDPEAGRPKDFAFTEFQHLMRDGGGQ